MDKERDMEFKDFFNEPENDDISIGEWRMERAKYIKKLEKKIENEQL